MNRYNKGIYNHVNKKNLLDALKKILIKDFNEDVSGAIYCFPETDTGKTIATFQKETFECKIKTRLPISKNLIGINKLKKIKLFSLPFYIVLRLNSQVSSFRKKRTYALIF